VILTLRQAAELTGKSKSTLTRAIKSGRLSASRDGEGMYAIDPAELARAYPFVERPDAQHDARHGTPRNDETEPDDAAILRLRLSLLVDEQDRERAATEREREQLAATVADLRMRLDRAEQRITALISDQKPRKRRSWWKWGRE
jgi:excisionase family DNA binding protein